MLHIWMHAENVSFVRMAINGDLIASVAFLFIYKKQSNIFFFIRFSLTLIIQKFGSSVCVYIYMRYINYKDNINDSII